MEGIEKCHAAEEAFIHANLCSDYPMLPSPQTMWDRCATRSPPRAPGRRTWGDDGDFEGRKK